MTDEIKKRSFTRFIPAVVRILLGLPLLFSGLNGLFHLFPEPNPTLPEGAMAFAAALKNSGYMMQMIFITHLIVGVLLLTNRFVPLALVLFAPFIVNAMAFHFFLEPSGRIPAAVFFAFEIYLMWQYRNAYRPLFTARAAAGAT